jgi:hypothetical protein
LITTLLTLFALFGDDARMASTDKAADWIFDIMIYVSFGVFAFDIIVNIFAKKEYLFGFFFWLDFVSTVSLLMDLTTVAQLMAGTGKKNDFLTISCCFCSGASFGRVARAGRAGRAGAKAGRVVRMIRVLRLFRLFKLYKKMSKKHIDEGERDVDQLMMVTAGMSEGRPMSRGASTPGSGLSSEAGDRWREQQTSVDDYSDMSDDDDEENKINDSADNELTESR